MSNHWHGVLTDPHARLPEFLERFHRLLAKAQNALLGRTENLWSSEKTSVVLLASHHAILEKMAYTVANPTNASLVSTPHEWPGVIGSCQLKAHRTVVMPDVFFDEHGELPKETSLEFLRPAIYSELDDAQFGRALDAAIAVFLRRAHQRLADSGGRFLGAKAIVTQTADTTPKTPASRGDVNPRIAVKSPVPRIRALQRIRDFARAYREAWLRWRDGARNAIFPAGTYALRVHCGVACASA